MTQSDLNSYRLSSLEEPTDEQLQAIMDEVGAEARKSSLRAKRELKRRMQELSDQLKAEETRSQA